MSLVRPEYGPSLPELAAPRWRTLPSAARIALIAGAVLIVAVLALLARDSSSSNLHDALVRKPIAFTLGYSGALQRVAPKGSEVLRLQTKPGAKTAASYTATPLRFGTYSGDVTAQMLSISSRRLAELQKADPNLRYRGEGKARINRQPAYQLSFQTVRNGRTELGKLIFVAPITDGPTGPPEGIELQLRSERSPAVVNIAALGSAGPLKPPLRSFRFGTSRP